MPQRIRHRVVFLAFLTSVLLYLDRFVLTYVERIIRLDLGLTEKQIGWGLSAFFWSYALFQVPSGLLTDRYGPRRMLTIYILLWSAGTALMGWMNGFAMLIAVRLAIGLAQAGAYPTCAAIVGRWVPLKSRGTASGIIAVGGRIGGGIAPLLTALLVVWFSADDSPELRSTDLLNPLQIADQLAFANSHDTLENATPDKQARLVILRRVTATFGAEQSLAATITHVFCEELVASQALADGKPTVGWENRFGMPPVAAIANPRIEVGAPMKTETLSVLWLSALRTAADGPLLATPAEAADLPLETEAERTILSDSPSTAAVHRANRLILEASLPGCIRPFYSAGWRPVMWVYGAAGIVAAALYWLVVRDWPSQHPRISETELAEINDGRPTASSSQGRPPLPLGAMITSRGLWLISGSQFFANIGWTLLVTLLPRYLQEAHHLSFADRSLYASIPLWCGWGGMFLGGIVTDRCVRRYGLRLGRVIPLAGSRLLGTTAFLGLLLEPSLPIALALLSLVAVAADFASPATWAFNQDIGGRFIASTLGWGNMWGNIGSALSPLIIAEVLDRSGTWTAPFLLCASTFAIAGLCTLFLDPRKSIDVHAPTS